MQQLAPRPSQHAHQIPYGLVSLWDMLRFHAEKYVSIGYWMTQMEVVYLSTDATGQPTIGLRMHPGPNSGPLEKPSLDALKEFAGRGIEYCNEFGLKGTERALRRIISEVDAYDGTSSNFADTLMYAFNEASRRFREDLEEHLFLEIHPARVASYKSDKPLGREATDAFKSARRDAREARRCYALEAYHASIYHSMMVLEVGLTTLATKLGVKFKKDRATWGSLIRDIREKITDDLNLMANKPKGTQPTPRADARKKAFLHLCQEAATEFSHFQNAWRDHIAHNRADYDEHDALKVLEHVESFMRVLATKLKLRE